MKKYIIGVLVIASLFSACEKKVDPIDTFHVTVEYRSTNPKSITNDITLNPKDSIYFDFTITSASDMSYVEIQKNGVKIDTFQLVNLPNKRSFSLIKGYKVDSIAGDYTYRVLARDARAVFLGDGGKTIKVTVTPDFNFWSYRVLKVPDTTAKTNKCYYSTSDGKTYSFSEGAAASATIDFGYSYDTTGAASSSTSDDLKHTIYALSVAQPQLNFYDISSWTKNATVFKLISGVNFVSQLTSSGAINTLIKNNMASGTATKLNKIVAGNVIGFKTVGGKYGAILIRYINQDSPAKETAIEIDVKVQK